MTKISRILALLEKRGALLGFYIFFCQIELECVRIQAEEMRFMWYDFLDILYSFFK